MDKLTEKFIERKKENPDYHKIINIKRIKKRITMLLGPNGTGKSRSLHDMKIDLQNDHTKFVEYSTSKDDLVGKFGSPFGNFGIECIAAAFHSEGERMVESFYTWMNGPFLKEVLSTKEPLYVFIDEADSGLSIDRLIETLSTMIFISNEEEKKGRELHFILTVNSYEMYEILNKAGAEAIWVPTGKVIKPKSYEDFKWRYVEYYEAIREQFQG